MEAAKTQTSLHIYADFLETLCSYTRSMDVDEDWNQDLDV